MASDLISGGSGAFASLFGSDAAPKAILNRFAAPTVKAAGKLSTDLLTDTNALSKTALDRYMAEQGRMEGLAGRQEGILSGLQAQQMGRDPNALLAQMDPGTVSLLVMLGLLPPDFQVPGQQQGMGPGAGMMGPPMGPPMGGGMGMGPMG